MTQGLPPPPADTFDRLAGAVTTFLFEEGLSPFEALHVLALALGVLTRHTLDAVNKSKIKN